MKLFNFNTPSITFNSKVKTWLFGYIFLFVWMLGISHLLHWLVPPPPPALSIQDAFPEPTIPLRYDIFIALIWAPIWEELVHRHAFGLVVKQIGNKFLLPAMIISSFLFATGHSDDIQLNVIRQGIMGTVFFYVYAKNGYSILSSILLHSAWNVTCMFAPEWIW